MKHKSKKTSVFALLLTLIGIAVTVAAIVYACSVHRRHLHDAKWKEYDECGLV